MLKIGNLTLLSWCAVAGALTVMYGLYLDDYASAMLAQVFLPVFFLVPATLAGSALRSIVARRAKRFTKVKEQRTGPGTITETYGVEVVTGSSARAIGAKRLIVPSLVLALIGYAEFRALTWYERDPLLRLIGAGPSTSVLVPSSPMENLRDGLEIAKAEMKFIASDASDPSKKFDCAVLDRPGGSEDFQRLVDKLHARLKPGGQLIVANEIEHAPMPRAVIQAVVQGAGFDLAATVRARENLEYLSFRSR